MGALHAGHLALIRRARQSVGKKGFVIASIFVNPAQFGPGEDFSQYPRPFAADVKLCRKNGVDLLFAPSDAQMYAEDHSTHVEETKLEKVLCGKSRPGHFCGVCTIVTKLFHIVLPDLAVFGRKDYQQLAVIERMARDLNFPVKIISVETVREADGLALSSRNQYLSVDERKQAPAIRSALLEARKFAKRGKNNVGFLRQLIMEKISAKPLARIDYVEMVDGKNLQSVERAIRGSVIAAAVFFGKTRLIDNIVV